MHNMCTADGEHTNSEISVQCRSFPIHTLFAGFFPPFYPEAAFILTQLHILDLYSASATNW